MESANSTDKWVVFALIGCGLAAFGYVALTKQRAARLASASGVDHSPIAVAAVRGGAGGTDVRNISPAEVAGDYVKSLQDDTAMARKNVQKYENNAKAHENEINKVNY